MRFMILVRATPDSEAGVMPPESMFAAMTTYHEALAKAGVLLDANGLQPSSRGWRVHYDHGQRSVIDGPFADTKELIAGYTMIQVRSRARSRLTARPATRTTPAMTRAVTAPQGERTGTQPTWRSRRSPTSSATPRSSTAPSGGGAT